MLSFAKFANRHFRRLTFLANNASARRFLGTSHVKFAEPLLKPNAIFNSQNKLIIRNNELRAIVMQHEDKVAAYDYVWKKLLDDSNLDIFIVNHYLHSRLDLGCPTDLTSVLETLKQKGIQADARTYGVFIQRSCAEGDMEETKKLLVALKNAHLEVDPFIFSCILHGYLKAGHPNEVEATKSIMNNFGLWPSRLGYLGLLSAYAELGDLGGFMATLNEGREVFSIDPDLPQPLLSVVGPFSALRLVVTLAIGMPDSKENATEILNLLPHYVDNLSAWSARVGILQLLMHNRPIAALELFKRIESSALPDNYLLLLGRAIQRSKSDPQLLSTFLNAANVPSARASLLTRRLSQVEHRNNNPPAFISVEDKTVEELFASASDAPSSALVHAIVPKLLTLGVTPQDIVKNIDPSELAPVAAIGCVLFHFPTNESPASLQQLNKARALCEEFHQVGLLPRKENLQVTLNRSNPILRGLIAAASDDSSNILTLITQLFEVINFCVGSRVDKVVALRLISNQYERSHSKTVPNPNSGESRLMNALVKYLSAQHVHFQNEHWVFYALEQMGVSKQQTESLRLTEPTQNKVDVIIHHLEGLLQKDAVTDASKIIRHSFGVEVTNPGQFDDAQAVENTSSQISASDYERAFWALWNAQCFRKLDNATLFVAFTYQKESNVKGLADFMRRVSVQLGVMGTIRLLNEQFMRLLLSHDFDEYLPFLQSMLLSRSAPMPSFLNATHILETLVSEFSADKALPTNWVPGTANYFPLTVLKTCMDGFGHLQKLRSVHKAIEILCRDGNLHAAHAVRGWARDLQLLLLHTTNVALVLTPYFQRLPSLADGFPTWVISHSLSAHTPVNLTTTKLAQCDAILFSSAQDVPNAVKAMAHWLWDTLPPSVELPITMDKRYLPSWLVLCQRLYHVQSQFVRPQTWAPLVVEWLNLVGPSDESNGLKHLEQWYLYAPTPAHQAAVVLGALCHKFSQPWALNQLKSNHADMLLYRLALLYPNVSYLSNEHQESIVGALSVLGRQDLFDLAQLLHVDPVDSVLRSIPLEQVVSDLIPILVIDNSLLSPVVEFWCKHHPERLVQLLNHLFAALRTSSDSVEAALFCVGVMEEYFIGISELDPLNRGFVHGVLRHREVTSSLYRDSLGLLADIFEPTAPRDTAWLNAVRTAIRQNDWDLVVNGFLLQLGEPARSRAMALIPYNLVKSHATKNLEDFLKVVSQTKDAALLRSATTSARPFLCPGLIRAHLTLLKRWKKDTVSWLDNESVYFYRLVLPSKEKKSPTEDLDNQSIWESTNPEAKLVKHLKEFISMSQSNPRLFNAAIERMASWDLPKVIAFLGGLSQTGSTDLVRQVLHALPTDLHPRLDVFVLISQLFTQSLSNDCVKQTANDLLTRLASMDRSDVRAILDGPHTEPLFYAWPVELLEQLLHILTDKSDHSHPVAMVTLLDTVINHRRGTNGIGLGVTKTSDSSEHDISV